MHDAVRDAARYAEHWLAVQHRVHDLPGLQVAIGAGDDVVLSRAYGVADVTTGEPLTAEHAFRVASHSKTFTATAVLQLVESGALRLDDRVDAWLDHLAGSPLGAATVRDLLGHGAGVSRDSDDGDFWQLFGPFPDEQALREITRDAADVLPVAERFKYSNLGYGLLGLVAEAASGQSYADLVAGRICVPLDLRRTGADWDESLPGPFAAGHTARATARRGEGRRPIGPVRTGALAPATGVYSTAEDMIGFAAGHYLGDPRLLPDSAKRRMQRPEWTGVRPDEDYGLGVIVTTIEGRRTVGHSGGFPGYITRTLWDPADRFAVSVLTNAIDGPASTLATTVVRLVHLAEQVPAEPTPEAAARLDRFTGHFANLWGLLDVVRLGGRLYALDPSAADPTVSPVHLTPEDDSTLRIGGGTGYGSPGETFRYTWTDDGSVGSLRAGSGQTMFPATSYIEALAAHPQVSGAVGPA